MFETDLGAWGKVWSLGETASCLKMNETLQVPGPCPRPGDTRLRVEAKTVIGPDSRGGSRESSATGAPPRHPSELRTVQRCKRTSFASASNLLRRQQRSSHTESLSL
jgi:hypothetical protein